MSFKFEVVEVDVLGSIQRCKEMVLKKRKEQGRKSRAEYLMYARVTETSLSPRLLTQC